MSYSGFAYPSLLLSAFTAVALCALPAQAQAPPGPGQLSNPPGQAVQGQPRQPAPPKPYKPIPDRALSSLRP